METVDVYVFTYECERPVAQIMVTVRPNYDEAFRWDIAADVLYQDLATDEWHAFPEDRATSILEDIRKSDPDKWQAIERAARANYAPDLEDVA